jgi:hypothetical protein
MVPGYSVSQSSGSGGSVPPAVSRASGSISAIVYESCPEPPSRRTVLCHASVVARSRVSGCAPISRRSASVTGGRLDRYH